MKKPISIPITHRLNFPDFTVSQPTTLLKFRDPALIAEVEQGQVAWERRRNPTEEDKVASLLENFSRIGSNEELVLKHRELFETKARTYLRDDAKYGDVLSAARVLGQFDDRSGYDFALKTFLSNCANDPTRRVWCGSFGSAHTNWLKQQPELLELLRETADLFDASVKNPMVITRDTVIDRAGQQTNSRALSAAGVLRKIGEPDRYLKIYREKLVANGMGYEVSGAARRLIEAGPTEEDLKNVLGVFESHPSPSFEPVGPDIAKLLCEFDFSKTGNPEMWESRVERKVLQLAQKKKTSRHGFRSHAIQQYRNLIYTHCKIQCADSVREWIFEEDAGYANVAALKAYRRLASEEEWQQVVIANIEGPRPVREFLKDYLEIHDQPEAETLKKLVCAGIPISAVAAMELASEDPDHLKLVALLTTEFLRLASLTDSLVESERLAVHRDMASLLGVLESQGYDTLELSMQLPLPSAPSERLSLEWRQRGISRRSFVDWLNEHFELSPPLTVEKIETTKHFFGYELRTARSNDFALAALGNLKGGNIVSCEITAGMLGEVGSVLLQMTKGAEPGVRHVEPSMEEQSSEQSCRFVIGNHTYAFNFVMFDDWWEWTPVVDILNAIAEEQEVSRRFFVYQAYWGNCDRLVLCVEPDTARELSEKFGLTPIAGCEFHYQQ